MGHKNESIVNDDANRRLGCSSLRSGLDRPTGRSYPAISSLASRILIHLAPHRHVGSGLSGRINHVFRLDVLVEILLQILASWDPEVYAQRAVKKTIQHELAAPELECRLPKTGKASLRQRASTLSHAAYLANIYRLLVISRYQL